MSCRRGDGGSRARLGPSSSIEFFHWEGLRPGRDTANDTVCANAAQDGAEPSNNKGTYYAH